MRALHDAEPGPRFAAADDIAGYPADREARRGDAVPAPLASSRRILEGGIADLMAAMPPSAPLRLART